MADHPTTDCPRLHTRVFRSENKVVARCNEIKKVAKDAKFTEITKLLAALGQLKVAFGTARDSIAARPDSPEIKAMFRVWEAAGLCDLGLPTFLEQLQQGLDGDFHVVLEEVLGRAKRTVADVLGMVGSLPSDLSGGQGEAAFRAAMAKHAAPMTTSTNILRACGKTLQEVTSEKPGAHDFTEVLKQTTRMAALGEFYICYFTALTLYRSPQMADTGGKMKAKLLDNLRIALTKLLSITFEEGESWPHIVGAQLREMCVFVRASDALR